jgi:hypothetical protein
MSQNRGGSGWSSRSALATTHRFPALLNITQVGKHRAVAVAAVAEAVLVLEVVLRGKTQGGISLGRVGAAAADNTTFL